MSASPLHPFWPKNLPFDLELPETSLYYNLEVAATRYPDKTATVFYDAVLNNRTLREQVDALAGWLESHCGVGRGDRVALSVTDSGRGVPFGEREAIFDRFVQFDTGGRTGLGLTIAKTFVEAHGEHIWVEDVAEGGARFVFTVAPADPGGAGPGPGGATGPASPVAPIAATIPAASTVTTLPAATTAGNGPGR